jgi:hypothetical protein
MATDHTGPSEEDLLRVETKHVMTCIISIFLKSGDDKATEARERVTDAPTVDDGARELKCWFEERGINDAAGGRVRPSCLADVWPLMAYQMFPFIDWVRLAHQIRNPDDLWLGGKMFGE